MHRKSGLFSLLALFLLLTACGPAVATTQTTTSESPTTASATQPTEEVAPTTTSLSYPIVDTNQNTCYDGSGEIECPAPDEPFYGQDAQVTGNAPSYTDNGDGTVTDNVPGLMWQKSPDTNGDGAITAADKKTYTEAVAYCENLSLAGYDDWRLLIIKQLYSLIDFSGKDLSGYTGSDASGLTPFINTNYFDFAYGDTSAGERIIDAQYASSTMYVSDAGEQLLFGVNFADGRIKGYDLTLHGRPKTFFAVCVRGNTAYGSNDFVNNGDGTITDRATGLMWAQDDSGVGMTWEEAMALGYSDWRLPNVKELQSIFRAASPEGIIAGWERARSPKVSGPRRAALGSVGRPSPSKCV